MRAKLTGGNQLVLPDEVALALDGCEFVDVEVKECRLLLSPLQQADSNDVYEKIEQLRITEQDIADAIAWTWRGTF